jgi:hypothetical protein
MSSLLGGGPILDYREPSRSDKPSRNYGLVSGLGATMPSKSIAVGTLLLLMLGLGFGSVLFPRAIAQPSKQTTSQLYQLEFLQESNCPYGSWLFPWAVVLNNSSVIVQPSNATLPVTYDEAPISLTSDINYSTIWFSVPNGTYNYTVLPKDPFNAEQSGNVTVDGTDVEVQVWEFITAMGCSSTTTTTSATTTVTATILVATTTTIVSTISGTITTITTTVPGTATTITSASSTGVNSGLLYAVAAVAAIFIIATGYLAMRVRKPAPAFRSEGSPGFSFALTPPRSGTALSRFARFGGGCRLLWAREEGEEGGRMGKN